MSEQLAQAFIQALHTLEDTKDAGPLRDLYADGAVSGNVLNPDHFQGQDGAEKFWTEYRGTFEQVHSEFRNVIATADRAALEWSTQGSGPNGKPLHYAGVTILEMDGDKITRSCAYFDPSSLGHQMSG